MFDLVSPFSAEEISLEYLQGYLKRRQAFPLAYKWTPLSEFLFEQLLKKKPCYRQRLIDYKIYLHQSRTQEVKKGKKLREESALASKGVLSQ